MIRIGPRDYRAERRAVAALCASLHPDVVHTHGYRADVVDAPAARSAGAATVTTVHGFTGGGWKNRLYEWLQIRAFRRFEGVVAVSAPLAGVLERRGIPKALLHTIVNAWRQTSAPRDRAAARRTLGVEGMGPRIGFVGRLTAEKGADVLLEALARLPDSRIMVSILGQGPERAALEARAARLGIADRVHWHGPVPDAGSLLAAFDALVIPSRTEGTPIVLFEAMAASVPIVATAVGGIPDVVSSQEAVLVPKEQPVALAEAIRSVIDDVAGARGRAAKAKARLDAHFGAGPWLRAYEELYRAAVARAGAAR